MFILPFYCTIWPTYIYSSTLILVLYATSISKCQSVPPLQGMILRQRGIKLGHLMNKTGKKSSPDSYLKKENKVLQLLREFTDFDVNLDTFWESQSSGEGENEKDGNDRKRRKPNPKGMWDTGGKGGTGRKKKVRG